MVEMKKLSVHLGENSMVILEGNDLKVDIESRAGLPGAIPRLLIVKDGDDTIAEFQCWDYWKKAKEE